MRAPWHIALLGCLALAQAGCGDASAGAAAYTCGHMRDTVGAFRQQAQLVVEREGLKASALSVEDAALDVELLLRTACRDAAAGYEPYVKVAGAAPER